MEDNETIVFDGQVGKRIGYSGVYPVYEMPDGREIVHLNDALIISDGPVSPENSMVYQES